MLNDEIPAIVDCYRFFAGAVRSMPGVVAGEYLPGHTSMVRRDPIGIVASIAPWNYPLMMMAWKLAPAIGGGNTVVFKPSEQTPLTALKLAKFLADVLPDGVVNIVLGRGDSVGNTLINHPKVNMISITGDVATGKKVLQAAAKSVIGTGTETDRDLSCGGVGNEHGQGIALDALLGAIGAPHAVADLGRADPPDAGADHGGQARGIDSGEGEPPREPPHRRSGRAPRPPRPARPPPARTIRCDRGGPRPWRAPPRPRDRSRRPDRRTWCRDRCP